MLNIGTAAPPPVLPPSTEEAYRRKCIQLRQRLNEVEAANDEKRLRISRVKRSIEKQRLERAFLIEKLASRSSTNVEDSEGSPSPPHTVCLPKHIPSCPRCSFREVWNLRLQNADIDLFSQRRSLSEPSAVTASHLSWLT